MWLHLQSDDSIASPGFKAVYQGRERTHLPTIKASILREGKDHSPCVRSSCFKIGAGYSQFPYLKLHLEFFLLQRIFNLLKASLAMMCAVIGSK